MIHTPQCYRFRLLHVEPFIILSIFRGFLHNLNRNCFQNRELAGCLQLKRFVSIVFFRWRSLFSITSRLKYSQNREISVSSISTTLFAATFSFCHQNFYSRSFAASHPHCYKHYHFQSQDQHFNSKEMDSGETHRD